MRIVPQFVFNMDREDELTISMPIAYGSTGRCFHSGKPNIAVFREGWGKDVIEDLELRKVDPDLRWIISVPILGAGEDLRPVWVLNVDGLRERRSDEELGKALSRLFSWSQMISLMIGSGGGAALLTPSPPDHAGEGSTGPSELEPIRKAKPQIFLSYGREDREGVQGLYKKLFAAGFKPWMDTLDILPGETWKSSIERAIRSSDFFLACLSKSSVSKRGFLQREIRDALDIWREKLDSDIYLIPVRLDDCDAPESLAHFQWVNLFEEDGWTRLVKAIQVGMQRRERTS